MRDYRATHALTLGGRTLSKGPCDLHMDDAYLLVKGDRTTRVEYDQLESIREVGRSLEVAIHPEGALSLTAADGALARPMFLHLSRLRGARWAELLRFVDGGPLDSLECKLTLDGGPEQEALFRVYPGGVVGIPLGGEVFQLPLHEMNSMRYEDYRLTLHTPNATAVLFGCEPRDLDRFHRSVQAARRDLQEDTVDLLKELFPALEFAELHELTDMLLRGSAAPKSALDAVAPSFWQHAEEVIKSSARAAESYTYLRERAGDRLWFGLRRLTNAEQRGEDEEAEDPEASAEPERPFLFWLMAGLGSGASRRLAVEVVAAAGGFATYVYRCPVGGGDPEAFAETARVVSRAMVALNFYREPLYAPEKEIEAGRFAEYKLAVRKLPYLRAARERFVGRAAHTTAKSWTAAMGKLLS
jgi:hypothetical protein